MKKIILPILLIILCQACLLGRPATTATPAPTETTLPTAIPTREFTATTRPTETSEPRPTDPPTPTEIPLVDLSDSLDLSQSCRTSVDGIHGLLDGLGYPDHLNGGDFTRHTDDFDPNQFFTVLTHLQLEPGYLLDYVVFQDGMGGKPLVYARKENDQPYASYDEFMAANTTLTPEEKSYAALYFAYDYLDKVVVDGTPESYLEYNLLAVYGDQWYLFWHSNYHDEQILCDPSDLASVQADIGGFGDMTLPAEVKAKALKLDFAPGVKMETDTVTVRFVYFTKWGGFIESIYTIDRADPFHVLDRQDNVLVEYNCGIMF